MAATPRDLIRLTGVHPTLVKAIISILGDLPMFVVVGLRTATEQAALYAQGRTMPGKIVTNCDGVRFPSNHQAYPSDGLGHAVDCAWLGNDPFSLTHNWVAYGAAVEAQGLLWGGRFTSPKDLDHAELK